MYSLWTIANITFLSCVEMLISEECISSHRVLRPSQHWQTKVHLSGRKTSFHFRTIHNSLDESPLPCKTPRYTWDLIFWRLSTRYTIMEKKKSENCKITAWMRLEGMSRGYLVQWPEEAGPSKAGCPGPSSDSK